jgi:8-oxo-dGTP diphosphatase
MQFATVAIIQNEGKYLIARRKMSGVVGGKWEFPGGKIKSCESPQEGLRRELREELNVDALVGEFFDEHIHRYKTGIFKIFAYMASCLNYKFNLSEHDEIRWVSASEMEQFRFTGNGKPIMKKLASYRQ